MRLNLKKTITAFALVFVAVITALIIGNFQPAKNNVTVERSEKTKDMSYVIVTFNTKGGSPISSDLFPREVDVCEQLSEYVSTKTGYNFAGWYLDSGASTTKFGCIGGFDSDTTLYAKWEAQTFKLTFNSNGGRYTTDQTDGQDYTTNDYKVYQYDYYFADSTTSWWFMPPMRSGYTFMGWNTKRNGTGTMYEIGDRYSTNSTTTFYAQWEETATPKYLMKFDANGGSGAPSSAYKTKDVSFIIPSTTPTRAGYSFVGWTRNSSGTGTLYAPGNAYTVNATTTFYAKWQSDGPALYTISYNANGGTGAPASEYKTHDITYKLSTTIPTRSGYTFAGWNTRQDGTGSNYAAGGNYTVNATQTFYAKWSTNSYYIVYHTNGGTSLDARKVMYNVAYGDIGYTTKENYVFAGWYLNNNFSQSSRIYRNRIVTTPNDHDVYARWVQKNNINFIGDINEDNEVDYNDYTLLGRFITGTADLTSTQILIADINKDGRVDEEDKSALQTIIMGDGLDVCVLTFNSNGGTAVATVKTNCDVAVAKPTNPSKSGYTFDGWYTNTGLTSAYNFNSTLTTSKTLYAKWTANATTTYTISYDANEGENAPASDEKISGEPYTISTIMPNRFGYSFQGWTTDITGLGTVYAPGATYTTDASTTFYAKWAPATYRISYNANGGTGAPATGTKMHGVAFTLSTVEPTRSGYTFAGWNTKANGSGSNYASGGVYTVNATQTFYATWTTESYYLSFNSNGGTEHPAIPVKYGEAYGNLPVPTRTGYIFAGWYLGDVSNTRLFYDKIVTKTENHTAYARWIKVNNTTFVGDLNYDNRINGADYDILEQFLTGRTTLNSDLINAADINKDRVVDDTDLALIQSRNGDVLCVLAFETNSDDMVPNVRTNCDTRVARPTLSTRSGYTLAGWYNEADFDTEYNFNNVLTTSKTIYAKWEQTDTTYVMSFDANGGTGAPAAGTKQQGVPYTLPTQKPTRDGFSFAGWATHPDGSSIIYPAGGTFTLDMDMTFYAAWSTNTTYTTYAVKYNYKGGTGGPTNTTAIVGQEYVIPTVVPTKSGYTFSYWTTTSNGEGSKYYPGTGYMLDTTTTFYAQYTTNTYYVGYYGNGGTGIPNSTQVEYNTSYTIPDMTPTRNGYTFKGWSANVNTTTGTMYQPGSHYAITSDTNFFAQWTPATYEIVYHANGGTGAPTKGTKQHNVNYTLSTVVPTRTGYTFDGWNTKQDGTGSNYQPGSTYTINASTTFYARWTTNSYYVEYRNDGDAPYSIGNNKLYGSVIHIATDVPTKNGYVFLGWTTNANGSGTLYHAGDTYTVTNHVTFYTQWAPDTLRITFNANGDGASSSVGYKDYPYGSNYGTLPTASRSGYIFLGWYTGATGGNKITSTDVVTTSRTLYAHWSPITYTVTFNSNGGSEVPSQNVPTGNKVIKPTDPTKTGHTFRAWQYSGSDYNFNTSVNSNMTLNATWNVNNYTVTFNPNGGTVIQTSVTVPYNTNIGTLPTPTWAGHEFVGWFTEATESVQISPADIITTSITLYAHWTVATYEMRYDANDGSGAPAKGTKTHGVAYTLSNDIPTRTGYTFMGWNTNASGTGSTYQPGSSYVVDATTTFYAQWEVKSYTITLDPMGGNLASTSITATHGSNYNLPTPTKDGYTFKGWYTNETGGTKITSSSVVTGDITLYARWGEGELNIVDISDYTLKGGYLVLPLKTNSNSLHVNDGYTLNYSMGKNKTKTTGYAGTGDIVTVYKSDNPSISAEYTVLVIGDINGDGKLTTMDSTAVVKHIMEVRILTGLDFMAADYYEDNKVSAMDHVKMVKYIMKED